jgi:CHAD domain-containing protein
MPPDTTDTTSNDGAFDQDPTVGPRLMAYAGAQLLRAQTQLAREGEALHPGIHEARKCIRRTRATIALGACAFDQRAARLDDELGRLCRGMSSLRDAQALVEALQRLENSAPAAVCAIVPHAVSAARKRRDQMLERALKRDPGFESRRRRLQAARSRLQSLQWQTVHDEDVSQAVARSERRAEKARRRAERHPDDDDTWHVFRRRLRRLRQQDSLLAELRPDLRPRIKDLEHRAHALGESQDDVLLLSHCGPRSPFTPVQRKLLRHIALERLQRARST